MELSRFTCREQAHVRGKFDDAEMSSKMQNAHGTPENAGHFGQRQRNPRITARFVSYIAMA
jgi:hypothetical protein